MGAPVMLVGAHEILARAKMHPFCNTKAIIWPQTLE